MARIKQGRQLAARLFSFLLVLLVMAVIFSFSAQPVKVSSGTSDGFVMRLIRWFLPDFDTLPAARQAALRHGLTVFVRKTAHVLEYAALGFVLLLHLETLPFRRGGGLRWLWAWLLGTLYAASDEVHQMFVPGRGPRLSDVGIDSAGVILGLAFLLLCARLFRKRKKE